MRTHYPSDASFQALAAFLEAQKITAAAQEDQNAKKASFLAAWRNDALALMPRTQWTYRPANSYRSDSQPYLSASDSTTSRLLQGLFPNLWSRQDVIGALFGYRSSGTGFEIVPGVFAADGSGENDHGHLILYGEIVAFAGDYNLIVVGLPDEYRRLLPKETK